MYVACSTLCFARLPLDRVMATLVELEFNKFELAIRPQGPHLTPAEVAADVNRCVRLLKHTTGLVPSAFDLDVLSPGPESATEFEAICKLGRLTSVATLITTAAPVGSAFDAEVKRLRSLAATAANNSQVLTVKTKIGTLTETPEMAVKLCEAVPGLGLTLDPSHFICGPHQGKNYDFVFPYVRHVHLRDSGKTPDKLQVRVGQGQIEFSRVVTMLEKQRYQRLLTVQILDGPDLPFNMFNEVRKLKFLLESLV